MIIGVIVLAAVGLIIPPWTYCGHNHSYDYYSDVKTEAECTELDETALWHEKTAATCTSDATGWTAPAGWDGKKESCEAATGTFTEAEYECVEKAVQERADAINGADTKDKCEKLDPAGVWTPAVGTCADAAGADVDAADKAACEGTEGWVWIAPADGAGTCWWRCFWTYHMKKWGLIWFYIC